MLASSRMLVSSSSKSGRAEASSAAWSSSTVMLDHVLELVELVRLELAGQSYCNSWVVVLENVGSGGETWLCLRVKATVETQK